MRWNPFKRASIIQPEHQWMICCFLVWALIGLNLFDGIGMIIGNVKNHSAPEFLLLKSIIPLQAQGAFLIVISIVHAYGMGGKSKLLDISAIIGATYYSLWAFGVLYSWILADAKTLGLLSKALFVTAIYLIVARYSPHPHRLSSSNM